MNIPTIETERLILRAPTEDDVTPLADFFAGARSASLGGPLERWQVWRAHAMIIGHWHLRGFGFWSVDEKSTGAFAGRVGLWYPDEWPEREIGWTVMDHVEGRGIAQEAARASRDYAYNTLGWTTAISLIANDNARSITLAKRLGAEYEAPFDHPQFGTMGIYRHPRPGDIAMSDDAIRAEEILADHRVSIDRLDAILVYTLAERFKHTQDVGLLKANHDLPPSDPSREAKQIARLESLAKDAGLDPVFAKKLLNFIISEVIRHHQTFQK